MKQHIKNSSKGFSLIEMIGVLAIIGILASVVAPKVFDAIRDGKITAAVSVLQTIKSSCTDYARKYNIFPTDGSKTPVFPEGGAFTRPYGDGADLNAGTLAQSTFGDILISEGMLEKLVLPIGPNGNQAYSEGSITMPASGNAAKPVNNDLNYPMLFCRSYGSLSNDTRLFSGAQNSTRVIFLLIPGLTTLEAAGLKTKIDGPFNETIAGPADLIQQALGGEATGAVAEAVNRGNCLITQNADGATFDCWLYVAHD